MTLNADQQAALRSQARSDPACAQPLAEKDLDALTALLSVGRTKPSDSEIGNGTIIDILGKVRANTVLDAIRSDSENRYVLVLLDQGRLKVGRPGAQAALVELVAAGLITQEESDKLSAYGFTPDPLSRSDVAEALFNPDGTEK